MPTNTAALDNFWMPFTANRQFKAAPRLLAEAEGMYYRSDDGRRVLDGTAGLWCVNAGHGRREIAEAVGEQLRTLDYAPTFQMGHPIVFDFAERLAAIAPGEGANKLDRVFFTGSGSESVDTALKIAIAYQRAIGQGTRTRLIGRERGYHGVGFGGISVGGIVNNRRVFPQLPGSDHLRHTHDLAKNAYVKGMPEHGAELALLEGERDRLRYVVYDTLTEAEIERSRCASQVARRDGCAHVVARVQECESRVIEQRQLNPGRCVGDRGCIQ